MGIKMLLQQDKIRNEIARLIRQKKHYSQSSIFDGESTKSAFVVCRNPQMFSLRPFSIAAKRRGITLTVYATQMGKFDDTYPELVHQAVENNIGFVRIEAIPKALHTQACANLKIADGEFFEAHIETKDGLKYFEIDTIESDRNVKKYTRHKDLQLGLDGKPLGDSAKREIPEFYKNPFGISDCDLCLNALRVDTYSDCIFGCQYCFARDKLMTLYSAFYDGWTQGMIRPTTVEILERGFREALARNKAVSGWRLGLRSRHAIHFATLTDPFQPIEKRFKISLKFLRLLKEYNHPVIISTKSILPLQDEYFKAITALKHVIVQVSLPTTTEEIARKLEPRAPLPKDRLAVTRAFKDVGIRTVLRVQPLIPSLTDGKRLLKTVQDSADNIDVMNTKEYFMSMNTKILEFFQKSFGMDIVYEMKRIGSPIDTRGAQIRANNVWALGQHLMAKVACHKVGIIHNVDASSGHTLSDQFHCCGGDGMKGFQEENLNLFCTKNWTRIIQKEGKLTRKKALSFMSYDKFHKDLMADQFDYGLNLKMTFGIKMVTDDSEVYYVPNKNDERFKKVLEDVSKATLDRWWDNWETSQSTGHVRF
jgi:DNA repair photolyase